jgi:hypothetical protein
VSGLPGPGRATKQGFALILAGALLACAAPASQPGARADAPSTTAGPPLWLIEPPPGCAAGFSGPTLDPGDAIRQARRSALESLAAERLGVRVDSELTIGARGILGEHTAQEVYGVLSESRIVAMESREVRSRAAPTHPRPPLREVYALACPADVPTPGVSSQRHPEWVLDAPFEPQRICVLGVGGPTRNPDDQQAAALRDGRRALAGALETLIERRVLDDGQGHARVVSRSVATDRALVLADAIPSLDESWLDTRGRGPIATPGLVYGLVCIDR